MYPEKSFQPIVILLLIGSCVEINAGSGASSENVHDPPVITPNFYDPNYHDDGRNHLRGPTAASSSSTISVMSPYAAASSAGGEVYNKPGTSTTSSGGGTIMAIVDHFYGPNGEEQVKYTNPNQMDKDEFEHILASLGSSGSTPSKLTYGSPSSSPQHSPKHNIQYSPQSSKQSPMPSKYLGAPLSSLYKSSSSPSYSTVPTAGYSLPSLYKSSSENSYSNKPPATYRPAYSTIYKDPPYPFGKQQSHYSKGSAEYSPSSYGSPKEPIHLHSPKEPAYSKGPSYYTSDSPPTPPKSISDAIYSNGYTKGYPPVKGIANGIDHDDSYPYVHHPPSYPPPPHMSHSPHQDFSSSLVGSSEYALNAGKYYSPSSGMIRDEYSYGKPPLKAGLHSLPMKYSGGPGPEYGISSSPPVNHHHDTYSAGFGGGYSMEDTSSPYSRPPTKGYMNRPPSPSYSSSPPPLPPHGGGHSLSSLYQPLAFDELYNSPGAKPMYAGGPMSLSKPGYGAPLQAPSGYALSYGPPVEYHMPPKGIGYTTSSSPYGSSPGIGLPKYKGPYRTVGTGPSGYALQGYGYGKPHYSSHHEDDEHETSNNDGISIAKDEYEDEAKFIRPPPSLPTEQQLLSPPSSMPPHLLDQNEQQQLVSPPSASHEAFHSHLNSGDSYPHAYPKHHHHHHDKKVPVHHPPSPPHHRPHHHPYHISQEIPSNEISHSPPRPNNNQVESSEEVHHIHVYEKGFFGKEKRLRGKQRHNSKWRPVVRNYRSESGSGEGGHGSASMERDARAVAAAEEAAHRGRRHRPPPPSRRRPMTKSNKRPYHTEEDEEGNGENGRLRPPHSRYSHHHG